MQGPYFYRTPELASSTSQSRSHRCPLRAAARDHGWMASPPEMSSGIPSAAQGQPTGAQCCPCPSSPTSHLLLLHPCVHLHGQGGGAGHDLLLALQDSAPVPLQDPSLGPTRGTDHPEVKPAPSVARARCMVTLTGAAPTCIPSPGFAGRQLAQAARQPSGHGHPRLLRVVPELHGEPVWSVLRSWNKSRSSERVISLVCSHSALPGRTGGGDLYRDKSQSVHQKMNSRSKLFAYTRGTLHAIKPPQNYANYWSSVPDNLAAFCTSPPAHAAWGSRTGDLLHPCTMQAGDGPP